MRSRFCFEGICSMNENRMDRICREAVNVFGITRQLDQAMEELAELFVEVSHVKRERPEAEARLLKEIADAKIMIRQMELHFDALGIVPVHMMHSLDKLEARIGNHRDPALFTEIGRGIGQGEN